MSSDILDPSVVVTQEVLGGRLDDWNNNDNNDNNENENNNNKNGMARQCLTMLHTRLTLECPPDDPSERTLL
jgi:hypothetical protein